VKRLVHPAVVQMNVVSVTDVHDVELRCDASLLVAETGESTPAEEEFGLDAEPGCSGFEELNTGEYAPTCTNSSITSKSALGQ